MTSPINLGNPFALGATGVQTSARTDRLAMGASFRPAATALAAMGGFLIGPAGTMGELTLVSDALLRVAPFLACIQGTQNTTQGQYIVPNTAQRDLAIPAKDATLSRRALIVVRVADSLEAGVASSATTDGAFLEVVPGALAASNPVLPPTPANAILAGELLIPSSASGQPVTITPYNPRTGVRGGILPVLDDTSTVAGHGAEPGSTLYQYRHHPTLGLQSWDGTKWAGPKLPTIRVYRIGSASYNSVGAWTPVPYDGLDDASTYNPGGAFFAYNPATGSTDRRLRILRDGLYRFDIESIGTGTLAGVRVARMTGPLTAGDGIVSSSALSASRTARAAAGDYVGGAILQSASDSPDGTNGYRNHLIVTRVGD